MIPEVSNFMQIHDNKGKITLSNTQNQIAVKSLNFVLSFPNIWSFNQYGLQASNEYNYDLKMR